MTSMRSSYVDSINSRVANKLIIFDDNKVSMFDGNYDDFLNKIGWKDQY